MSEIIDLEQRRLEDDNIRRKITLHIEARIAACADFGLDPADMLREFRELQVIQLDLMQEMGGGQRPFDTIARETIAEIDRQLTNLV